MWKVGTLLACLAVAGCASQDPAATLSTEATPDATPAPASDPEPGWSPTNEESPREVTTTETTVDASPSAGAGGMVVTMTYGPVLVTYPENFSEVLVEARYVPPAGPADLVRHFVSIHSDGKQLDEAEVSDTRGVHTLTTAAENYTNGALGILITASQGGISPGGKFVIRTSVFPVGMASDGFTAFD